MTVKVQSKTKKKSPPVRYRTTREYDFLQYIRLVMKWATVNNDLLRGEVELLLYLYPMGTFSKKTFNEFHKTYGMYQMKTFSKMINEGWIVLWRPRKNNETALYALTNKAKTMCSKMHKFCTGELEIPESTVNALRKNDKSKPRIYDYYMDAIIKMNKNRRKENRDEE